jgi:hypothetical protein
MSSPATSARDLLRHCLATIAYRGAKVLHGAPDSFVNFRSAETTRTPVQILAHLGDLFDWALSMAKGQGTWHSSKPLPWHDETQRFFASLRNFDAYLAGDESLCASPEKIFQGPVADALNHIGQLAMLRRMAGAPIKGENYFVADISLGHVGQDQPKPRIEFD